MPRPNETPDTREIAQGILNLSEEKIQAMIENIRNDFMDERSDAMLRAKAIKILMRNQPIEVKKAAKPTRAPYKE